MSLFDNSTILRTQLNWKFERVVAKTKAAPYVNPVNAAALSKKRVSNYKYLFGFAHSPFKRDPNLDSNEYNISAWTVPHKDHYRTTARTPFFLKPQKFDR